MSTDSEKNILSTLAYVASGTLLAGALVVGALALSGPLTIASLLTAVSMGSAVGMIFSGIAVFTNSFHGLFGVKIDKPKARIGTAAVCAAASLGAYNASTAILNAQETMHGALQAAATQVFQPTVADAPAAPASVLTAAPRITVSTPDRAVSA